MIGQTLWTEFFTNRDWPVASAVAVVLLTLLVAPIVAYQHFAGARIGARRMTMRRLTWFNIAAIVLGIAFLYLPIAILVIYSFNASQLVTVWGGWSTRWYGELLARSADARCGADLADARRSCRPPRRPCSARWRRWR